MGILENIICKTFDHSEPHLVDRATKVGSIASATLFPVGWSVQDRIGWSLSQLHCEVPTWQKKVGGMAER